MNLKWTIAHSGFTKHDNFVTNSSYNFCSGWVGQLWVIWDFTNIQLYHNFVTNSSYNFCSRWVGQLWVIWDFSNFQLYHKFFTNSHIIFGVGGWVHIILYENQSLFYWDYPLVCGPDRDIICLSCICQQRGYNKGCFCSCCLAVIALKIQIGTSYSRLLPAQHRIIT